MDIQIFPTENATQTIQKAIDELFSIGGGRVVIHKGEYQISSLLLRSDVTLYLKAGACLKGSRLPDDYDISDRLSPESGENYTDAQNCPIAHTGRGWIKPSGSTNPFSRWSRAMIKAYRAKNIAIIGEQGAVFDGQNCYDEKGEEGFRGPHFINFHECEGIHLRGYTLQNSSNWGHALFTSSHILCEELTILAGHDGIDFLSCDDVTIRCCTIRSGDDAIAGFDCKNVLVEDCFFSTACNAMRIGGEVTVRRCRIVGSGEYGHRVSMTLEEKKAGKIAYADNARHNMLSAFEYYSDFRYAIRSRSDIVIEDCEIENCDKLISYCFTLPKHQWCKNEPLHSLKLQGVRAKNVGLGCRLYAPDDHPLTVECKNCTFEINNEEFGIAQNTSLSFENVRFTSNPPLYFTVSRNTDVRFVNSDTMELKKSECI